MRPPDLARRILINGAAAVGADRIQRLRENSLQTRRVRAMYLHGSPPSDTGAFRNQLRWLREHFQVIDFAELKRLWSGGTGGKIEDDPRTRVLLTFDDGLATNYETAAPLLEEFGMRGVFFVVPRFSQCAGDESAAREYHFKFISRSQQPWRPMSPGQIGDLALRGHTIGNHTMTHRRLSEVPPSEYDMEINRSADLIELWTAQPVEAFSWTFIWHAITRDAHQMICRRHPYCFSPCPGLTDLACDSPALIWRTHVEPNYRPSEYRFMYSGLSDVLWRKQRLKLREILGDLPVGPA